MRKVKTKWTLAQWIAFGNRVKKLKADLYLIIDEATPLCAVPEISQLWMMDAKIDRFKSKMEHIVARDVPEEFVTRIFYGDPMEELTTAQPAPEVKSPSKAWPKWYVPKSPMISGPSGGEKPIAYALQHSEYHGRTFHTDGSSFRFETDKDSEHLWDECTETVALARMPKSAAPLAQPVPNVESPEDWVEITDPAHVVRECDELNCRSNPPDEGWMTCLELGSIGNRVRFTELRYRCRRKDFPVASCAQKPSEEFPKWYVPRYPNVLKFIALKQETPRKGLQYGPQSTPLPFRWDGLCQSLVDHGSWIEVTEAEAMAQITAATPPEMTSP